MVLGGSSREVARHAHRHVNDLDDPEENSVPTSTARVRYWVSVASSSTGGLVVAEFETLTWGYGRGDLDVVPDDVNRFQPCTNMNEKVKTFVERFKGKLLERVEDFRGNGFVACWDVKNVL